MNEAGMVDLLALSSMVKLAWATLALVAGFFALRYLDERMERRLNTDPWEELFGEGNLAAGIYLGARFVGLAVVVAAVIS